MPAQQDKNREDEEIKPESLKREVKTVECASCGKRIKKKTLWRKGRPYCCPECVEG